MRRQIQIFLSFLRSVIHNEQAVTAIEYALIAGAIAIAIVGILTTLGTDIGLLLTAVTSKITGLTK